MVAPAAPRRRSGGAAKPAAFCPVSSWAWSVYSGKEKFAERFHRWEKPVSLPKTHLSLFSSSDQALPVPVPGICC